MPTDTNQIQPKSAADAGRLRLLTLDSLDGRTRAAKMARALVDSIEDDLGGADRLSAAQRQMVQRAAVLGALLESQEAAWLAGEPINLSDYLPALNAQRRQLEALGLERRSRDLTPDLRDYVAGKAAA